MELTDVGRSSEASRLIKEMVPNPGHRAQCLHHSLVLGAKTVFYVVAKESLVSVGEIMYVCIVHFSESPRTGPPTYIV